MWFKGKARGITVTFSERLYSLPEIKVAVDRILAQKPAFEALGFEVESVGGIRDHDGAIRTGGYAFESPGLKQTAAEGASVEAAAQDIAKIPVKVTDGVRADPATRSNCDQARL